MTRKDYILLSATLKAVRDSYAPHWDPNLFRACDDHAKAVAAAIGRNNAAFDQTRFIKDSGAQQS